MNRNTYEEKFSVEISPLAVFVFVTISTLVLIILTTVLITITPLREYIPGYGSSKQGRKILLLQSKVDSLQQSITDFDEYRQNIQNIFVTENFAQDTMAFHTNAPEKIKQNEFAFSEEDSILMHTELQSKSNNISGEVTISKHKAKPFLLLFIPFSGKIVNKFNLEDNQFGIKIIGDMENELHSIASGNVIVCKKISRYEQLIVIQYPNNMISVYKFKGESVVEQGGFIKAGQVIGTNTDTENEVYFELWINGKPVNPENYIAF